MISEICKPFMENRTCKISKIIYNKKKGVKSMKKFILPKNPMGGGGVFRSFKICIYSR